MREISEKATFTVGGTPFSLQYSCMKSSLLLCLFSREYVASNKICHQNSLHSLCFSHEKPKENTEGIAGIIFDFVCLCVCAHVHVYVNVYFPLMSHH